MSFEGWRLGFLEWWCNYCHLMLSFSIFCDKFFLDDPFRFLFPLFLFLCSPLTSETVVFNVICNLCLIEDGSICIYEYNFRINRV